MYISVLSMVYVSYSCFQISHIILESTQSLNSIIIQSSFSMIQFSLVTIQVLFPQITVPESDFQIQMKSVYYVMEQINIIGKCFFDAMITSVTLATLVSVFATLMTMYDFQDRVLNMRMGRYSFDKTKYKYSNASQFVGCYLANTIFSFLIFAIMLTVVLTVIYHPIFWRFLKEQRSLIILFALLTFSIVAISIIHQKFFKDAYGRSYYFAISVNFESIIFICSFIGGFFISLTRIFLMMLVQLIGYFRMDQTILPTWMSGVNNLDLMNRVYIEMIYQYHEMNNPIVL